MKKFLKNGLLLIIACFSLTFVGCKEKSQTYSNHGMTITMTEGFYEKSILTSTYYLESQDSLMHALKEEFNAEYLPENTTLEYYTSLVIQNNKLNVNSTPRDNDDYLYFTYEKTVSGKDYFYLATTHKSYDAFWLIQFACVSDDKDEFSDKFLSWADTITFETSESN